MTVSTLDLRMPGLDGLSLLAWLRESGPPLPVIVISAYGDVRDQSNRCAWGRAQRRDQFLRAHARILKPHEKPDLSLSILIHLGIWGAVGAAAGIAFGLGYGTRKVMVGSLIGGMIGAAMATLFFDIGGAFVPMAHTERPFSSWPALDSLGPRCSPYSSLLVVW